MATREEYRFVCILDESPEGAQEVLEDWVVVPTSRCRAGYAGCNSAKSKSKGAVPYQKLIDGARKNDSFPR